ncbi:MAG TPA: hypothetical protein PK303_04920 [bacterium]|nr:hypothetical protein [bacterium]HOL34494.1 hypothetical protein [bacterium]HPP08447.1 hypothetical protein [bacterium]
MKLMTYFLILLLGFLIGTTIGEILSLLLPENLTNLPFFAPGILSGFDTLNLNLKVINVNIGIRILSNTFSWLGLLISTTILLVRELAGSK